MSKHLPECHRWFANMPEDGCPACEMFRACKQRVLDAAREAVQAELGWEEADPSDDFKPHTVIWKFRALAAIEALREKP